MQIPKFLTRWIANGLIRHGVIGVPVNTVNSLVTQSEPWCDPLPLKATIDLPRPEEAFAESAEDSYADAMNDIKNEGVDSNGQSSP